MPDADRWLFLADRGRLLPLAHVHRQDPPSSVEDATTGAAATRLGQGIPNPTSGEVMVPYSLAANGHVSITLYNSLLQQVATVVDAEEPSGPHTAQLDASALPPGAYYYRLHAGSVNLTRQMVIVR